MSQKFIKKKQTSPKSLGYGKYYAKAVYNSKCITTRQIADFIQTQASVSPCWTNWAAPCSTSWAWARR